MLGAFDIFTTEVQFANIFAQTFLPKHFCPNLKFFTAHCLDYLNSYFKFGRCSTAQNLIARKSSRHDFVNCLTHVKQLTKKVKTVRIRLILGLTCLKKNISSSLTIRPKLNDCLNHNCSNQSKLLDMCGIQLRQEKTCGVYMCGIKNTCGIKVMNMYCRLG